MFKPFQTLVVCLSLAAGLCAPAAWANKTQAEAPAAVASAAAPAQAAAPAAEENPYGLSALWAQGDAVAKGTLFILVVMSMASWYVLFTKYAEQAKLGKQAKQAQEKFWSAGTVRQGADALDEASAFRFIAEKGIEGTAKHTGLLGTIDFNEWVGMSLQRAMSQVQSRLQDGLAFLATAASPKASFAGSQGGPSLAGVLASGAAPSTSCES